MKIHTKNDFQPIESFSLIWRWTDEDHNVFPDEILQRIKPLKNDKAHEVNEYASNNFYEKKETTKTCRTSGDEQYVQNWLFSLPINSSDEIIISWDNETAVLTDWEVFSEYWDGFCYPTSDEVAIWSPSNKWVLLYEHSEYFTFSERL